MSKRRKIVSEINDNTDKQEDIISQLKNKKDTPAPSEEKGTVRVTLDIPKPLHKKIKSYTKARGQSINGYLLFLASQDMDS
jgi:NRPS condensation-like uncharacterized protein